MTTTSCRFCDMQTTERIRDFGTVFAVPDGYPVSPGHHLIIPFRHCREVFDLTEQEMLDTRTALNTLRADLTAEGWEAFNVGWNAGAAAGQTVGHAHCHLIPRTEGDVIDPVGGIRGVVPSRRNYLATAR